MGCNKDNYEFPMGQIILAMLIGFMLGLGMALSLMESYVSHDQSTISATVNGQN